MKTLKIIPFIWLLIIISSCSSNENIVPDFLEDTSSIKESIKSDGNDAIIKFQEEADVLADRVVKLNKENLAYFLEDAKHYKYCVVTVEDYTIVKIIDLHNTIMSGSWDLEMPFGEGYIKTDSIQQDYINNLIGKEDGRKRIGYLFDVIKDTVLVQRDSLNNLFDNVYNRKKERGYSKADHIIKFYGKEIITSTDNFKHYSPPFFTWLHELLINYSENSDYRQKIQDYYNSSYIKDDVRNLYSALIQLNCDKDRLKRMTSHYEQVMYDERTYLNRDKKWDWDTFSGVLNESEDIAKAFWIRRNIDGSKEAFEKLILYVIKTYDTNYADEIECPKEQKETKLFCSGENKSIGGDYDLLKRSESFPLWEGGFRIEKVDGWYYNGFFIGGYDNNDSHAYSVKFPISKIIDSCFFDVHIPRLQLFRNMPEIYSLPIETIEASSYNLNNIADLNIKGKFNNDTLKVWQASNPDSYSTFIKRDVTKSKLEKMIEQGRGSTPYDSIVGVKSAKRNDNSYSLILNNGTLVYLVFSIGYEDLYEGVRFIINDSVDYSKTKNVIDKLRWAKDILSVNFYTFDDRVYENSFKLNYNIDDEGNNVAGYVYDEGERQEFIINVNIDKGGVTTLKFVSNSIY